MQALFGWFRAWWWWVLALVAVLIIVWFFFLRSSAPKYQFATVTRGSITQTVSVTGNTAPTKSVALGFQGSGTIARVSYGLGDFVTAGSVIAELNTASLGAALAQARANLAVAQANLDALTAGTRPEQLAIDESAVTQDEIALANAVASAYAASDSAIHTTADQFFTNPRTKDAALTFVVPDATLTAQVEAERVALEPVLAAWNAQVSAPTFATSDPLPAATDAGQHLAQVSAFLNDAAAALTKAQPAGALTAATLTTYGTNVAAARTSIASAQTALASARAALVGAQGALALAQAGSTTQAIAAQEAQVAQAQAGVASAEANLANAEIVAPISGTLTQQDAKVGQQATPGTPLVSIIGTGGFEVDTGVSDTDVGKLAVGDQASMTLDAFPNETFAGTVFYIAPAETDVQGVVSYQVKIAFVKEDARLKSGLSANLDIETKHKDDALILPQYAILQNDAGTFVEHLDQATKAPTTTPVTLGIQDQNGNVELLSGVIEGEQVITVGLKQ
jgi:HlyD family secretion protein